MNNYLLTLLIKNDVSESDRKGLLEGVKKRILGDTGKIVKEDLWGVRDLAYPIKHQEKGFYAHFEFETDPKVAKTLDSNLKVEEDILRFLLTRHDIKKGKKEKVSV